MFKKRKDQVLRVQGSGCGFIKCLECRVQIIGLSVWALVAQHVRRLTTEA